MPRWPRLARPRADGLYWTPRDHTLTSQLWDPGPPESQPHLEMPTRNCTALCFKLHRCKQDGSPRVGKSTRCLSLAIRQESSRGPISSVRLSCTTVALIRISSFSGVVATWNHLSLRVFLLVSPLFSTWQSQVFQKHNQVYHSQTPAPLRVSTASE